VQVEPRRSRRVAGMSEDAFPYLDPEAKARILIDRMLM
jgi:hypothetical protein